VKLLLARWLYIKKMPSDRSPTRARATLLVLALSLSLLVVVLLLMLFPIVRWGGRHVRVRDVSMRGAVEFPPMDGKLR
jgi:hypothetical protein